MTPLVETTAQTPEGAVAVTAKDVISQAVPERLEDVEYWLVKSSAGLVESVRIRPEIGEKAELHTSPLDGSVLGIRFLFKNGDAQNEISGRRYMPMQNIFHFDIAYHKDPVYKNGESPAEVELKRRARAREQSLQQRAAKLAEGLDDPD